jgi:hypothetical protein
MFTDIIARSSEVKIAYVFIVNFNLFSLRMKLKQMTIRIESVNMNSVLIILIVTEI